MRVLIAPDAFKGSLSAAQAAGAMAAGIRDAMPDAEIEMLPLADGGEGTADVLLSYLLHEENIVSNDKYIVYRGDDGNDVALIESARCLGLMLPAMRARDVWRRGSGALGDGIRHALDAGIRRFVIALGGSATNDAGLGLLAALGLHAFDEQGREVSPDLQGLLSVRSLDIAALDSRLADSRLTVLSDVDSPLCGPMGATFTFGPQKGLAADRLEEVDRAMSGYAELTDATFGNPVADVPGDGAAGGLGFALRLLGGRVVSGADYVIGKTGLARRVHGVDLVVTGEGRSDTQTLTGKLPLKVAEAARAAGARVALVSGSVDRSVVAELEKRFDCVISAQPEGMPDDQAIKQAMSLLTDATVRLGGMIG
jgi:glycerate kinase